MIRVLLYFFLLEVCFCSAGQKKFGEKGNYITTVIYVDFPSFSDSIDVGDVFYQADNFKIQYNNVTFFKLSSTYSLGYRIDLSAHVVQLIIRLGKAQIKGVYRVTSSSTDTTSQDFELNLYADLIYTHEILFQVDEKREVSFGKTENHRLMYKKVKGKYTNPPNAFVTDLENYLNPNLLKAVVAKIYDEVLQKVSLHEVSFQITNEIAFERRYYIADRFKKAIAGAFEDVQKNAYNVFYSDRTYFQTVIQNFDVTMPSFVLRDVEGYKIHDMKISFFGDHVRAKVQFLISSPLALFRIVYRNRDDPSAKNMTVKAEFQLSDFIYQLEIVANPEANAVKFGSAAVKISAAKVASTQGLYGDERDSIILQLRPYIESYVPENASRAFVVYVKGLVAEERIAHEVFK